MTTLMKLLTIPAMVIAFSVGVALAASGGSSEPTAQVAPATSTDDTTSTIDTTTGTTTTEDRNDDRGDRRDDDAREPGEDVRGPCDEAEHANDPRCTGVGDHDRDDNSGPDNAEDDDRGEDRADNSGPGNADDDDNDNGGHGGDDRSGHSGGNDD